MFVKTIWFYHSVLFFLFVFFLDINDFFKIRSLFASKSSDVCVPVYNLLMGSVL